MVLIIKPISAQIIHDTDLIGKMDPYCVCIVGSEKQRTKTHKGGGKKPQWYDTLQFHNQDSLMRVELYDDDWGKDDLLGQGTVNLNQLFSNPNRTENEYVDLIRHGKPAGRILISMEYQGQSMGGNQGWGQQQGQGGWGNNPNQGWGNNPNQGQGGWGNNPNQGWGNNPNQGQGGWGNNPNQGQGGWGNNPNQGQGGWGNNPNQGQGGWGNNPNQGQGGWGNNPNQGWGNNQGW